MSEAKCRQRVASPAPRATKPTDREGTSAEEPEVVLQKPQVAPPALVVLTFVQSLGIWLSYMFGHRFGEWPMPTELAPPTIVVCCFVIAYSLCDCVGVGKARWSVGWNELTQDKLPAKMPEEFHLAHRAQMNQVEQFAGFVVGTMSFAVVVNGRVAAALSLCWVVLRIMYGHTYRHAFGKSINESGLQKFTVPCYFLLLSMASGTVVHILRIVTLSI